MDDQLERETVSLIHGAPLEERADEARELEGAAEDEPIPEAIVGGRSVRDVGAFTHLDARRRSELARVLRPSVFPADRAELIDCAVAEHAPEELLMSLRDIADRTYGNVEQVWEAMGGHPEVRE